MGIEQRRLRERETVRERALEAARRVAETDGWDGVTIRKVAEQIEYAPSVLYAHFTDKTELLQHVAAQGLRDVIEILESLPKRRDPVEALADVALAQLNHALAAPDLYRLMFNVIRETAGRQPIPEVKELRIRKRALLETRLPGDGADQRDNWDIFEASVHGLSMLAIDAMIPGGPVRARRLARSIAERHLGP